MKQMRVGISYATEQQEDVNKFVDELKKLGINYLYDEEHPYLFWGEYAPEILSKLYENVDCVVAFISPEYLQKALPVYEMRIAFYKQIHSFDGRYNFLPILYDGTKMPDFYHGKFYLSREKYSIEEIAQILYKKIKNRNTYKRTLNIKTMVKNLLKFNFATIEVCDTNSKNFKIIKKDIQITSLLQFKFNEKNKEYFVFSNTNILLAVLKPTPDKIIIQNYGLFPFIANEMSEIKFLDCMKELLKQYE